MKTIRDKTAAWGWARQAAGELKAELAQWRGRTEGQPEGGGQPLLREIRLPLEPGGWWHQYVCPEHHAELLFDPMEEDAVQFRCPHGCVLEGEPYRGAWLVFRHQTMARYALQAAAVYAADGEEWCAGTAREILAGYARQFPHYPVHPDAQPWMLKGRAFHQALTEAIWSTTLIRAYLLLKDCGVEFDPADEEALQTFFTMLESSMEQYRHILIHEKKNAENNYTAWLNASLACVYAAKGADKAKLQSLLDGPGGFYHHLSIGVKPDGFEFEGSTYYHVFVLRAYLIAAEMCLRFGVDLYGAKGEAGQSLQGMLQVLAELASDSGQLPALHDGPYNRVPFAREIVEVFEAGLSVYGNRELLPVLAHSYRYLFGAEKRGGLEALVYGNGLVTVAEREGVVSETARQTGAGEVSEAELFAAPAGQERRSLLLEESGFAVLRHKGNSLSVQTDFGEHGGSHGHFDKLHVSIMHQLGEVAPELGTVPYGSALRLGWYATTASHNTVSIGGRSQAPHTAACTLLREDEGGTCIRLRSEGAYPGTVLERHLLLDGELLVDWFRVETESAEAIDWWMHPSADLVLPRDESWMGMEPRTAGTEDGYAHVELLACRSNTSSAAQSAGWHLNGEGASGDCFKVQAALLQPPEAELYHIRTPGIAEDPSRSIGGLLMRQKGTAAEFVAVYRAGEEPLRLSAVEQSGVGLTLQVEAGMPGADSFSRSFAIDPVQGLVRLD
jgi:oligo-alginate lyase